MDMTRGELSKVRTGDVHPLLYHIDQETCFFFEHCMIDFFSPKICYVAESRVSRGRARHWRVLCRLTNTGDVVAEIRFRPDR